MKCLRAEPAQIQRVIALRQAIDAQLVDKLPFLKGLVFLLEQLALGCKEMQCSAHSNSAPTIERVGRLQLAYILILKKTLPLAPESTCV